MKLLDDDGENGAVRWFLAAYGGGCSKTIGAMQAHLKMSGFEGCWPDWCNTAHPSQHLTKGGAQQWIRHLFSLEAQQVAVPAWVPMTVELLNSQEPWLYQPIWIAGEFGVEQATYEWRQGRYPHCFDTSDGHGRGLSEITHAMPVEIPASPQGAKP